MRDLRLYWAYGSNMSPATISEKGLVVKHMGVAYLDHYAFMLNKISQKDPTVGFANIAPCWAKRVYGSLFDLGNTGKSGEPLASDANISSLIRKNVSILDKKEGFPIHYERTTIGVHINFEGKMRFMQAFTYIATFEKTSPTNLFVKDEYALKINEGLDGMHAGNDEYEKYKHDTKQLMEIWKASEKK